MVPERVVPRLRGPGHLPVADVFSRHRLLHARLNEIAKEALAQSLPPLTSLYCHLVLFLCVASKQADLLR